MAIEATGGDVLPSIPISVCHNATLAERSVDLASFVGRRESDGGVKVSTVQLIQYVAKTLGGSPLRSGGEIA